MLEKIRELLIRVWKFLKKIYEKVVSFIQNIVVFFKSKYDRIIRKYPNATAVSLKIKAILESGDHSTIKLNDYQIINAFYDKDSGEILLDESQVISYESLDEQTKESFADKELIVIEL